MTGNVVFALCACVQAVQGVPDSFTTETLQQAKARISPALGLLRYSLEVTNPQDGESSRRDRDALALIVSPDGLAITHGHMLVENSEPFNISVTVGEDSAERTYDAKVIGKPDQVNIVFLRLEAREAVTFPFVKFDAPTSLEFGEPLATYGMHGETLDFARGIEQTRISAVLTQPRTTYALVDNLRFGFIGAPVIDVEGHIVGVTGFDLSRQEGGELYVRSGHPLLYQSELFTHFIEHPELISSEEPEAEEAWLGVFTQPLTDDFAEYWDLKTTGGLIVSTVVPGSPAQEVLKPGDVITNFNNTSISARFDRDLVSFTKLVREAGAHTEVPVEFIRNGEEKVASITLGTRPRSSQYAAEFEDETLGVTVREITTDVRIAMNLSNEVKGVIVRKVKSGSPAQLGKVSPGAIIQTMDGKPVSDIDSFKGALAQVKEAKPRELSVYARTGAAQGFYRMEPRW